MKTHTNFLATAVHHDLAASKGSPLEQYYEAKLLLVVLFGFGLVDAIMRHSISQI